MTDDRQRAIEQARYASRMRKITGGRELKKGWFRKSLFRTASRGVLVKLGV